MYLVGIFHSFLSVFIGIFFTHTEIEAGSIIVRIDMLWWHINCDILSWAAFCVKAKVRNQLLLWLQAMCCRSNPSVEMTHLSVLIPVLFKCCTENRTYYWLMFHRKFYLNSPQRGSQKMGSHVDCFQRRLKCVDESRIHGSWKLIEKRRKFSTATAYWFIGFCERLQPFFAITEETKTRARLLIQYRTRQTYW